MLHADGDLAPGFAWRDLFRESYCRIVREGHPMLDDGAAGDRRRVPPERLARLPRAVIFYPEDNSVLTDNMLSAFGMPEAEVRFRIPHFLAAPLVVAGTDQVVCLPARGPAPGRPRAARGHRPAQARGSAYRVAWHKRIDGDPALAWARELLTRVTAQAGLV